MMIDQNTSRADLLAAIYTDWDLVDVFVKADIDPEDESVATDIIRNLVVSWIEAGDECAG